MSALSVEAVVDAFVDFVSRMKGLAVGIMLTRRERSVSCRQTVKGREGVCDILGIPRGIGEGSSKRRGCLSKTLKQR